MDMKPNEIKLEEFSNCPGSSRIKEYLYEHNLNSYIEIVDIQEPFYQNDRDTFVLAIIPGPTESQVALALGKLAVEFSVDEFTWKSIDGKYVVRIWWD